jgi:ferredoxin--NADP+ reductase
MDATIVRRIEVTEELIRLFIKPETPLDAFLPGQHVGIGSAGAASAPLSYSISSSPMQTEVIELFLSLGPGAACAAALGSLREGDKVNLVSKARGSLTLAQVPDACDLVLVATGTGVAPYMSMLRTPSTWHPGRRSVTLVHGVRNARDLGYERELAALKAARPDVFTYVPVVSRPDGDWSGIRGRVQEVLFERGAVALEPERDHVFLCGNRAMVEDLRSRLMGMGYTLHTAQGAGNLHVELP